MVTIEENSRLDYPRFKAKLLEQFGLTDMEATEAYLRKQSENAATDLKRKIQIDNAARSMLMHFYDGDRTYVKEVM